MKKAMFFTRGKEKAMNDDALAGVLKDKGMTDFSGCDSSWPFLRIRRDFLERQAVYDLPECRGCDILPHYARNQNRRPLWQSVQNAAPLLWKGSKGKMITHGAGNFIKGTNTRIAAFNKRAVQARAVNSGVAGDCQHTPRFGRDAQCVSKQAGIGIVFRLSDRSLNKSLYIFLGLEFLVNIPIGCFHIFLLYLFCQFMGILDVSPLCTFITSAEQKDNLIIADSEIEAVSGAIIYTHRPDFPAFRRPIPEVTHTGAFNPCPDAGLSPIIPQILKPFCKNFSLSDFVHNINVDYYLRIVKGIETAGLGQDEAASKGSRFYWKPVQKGLIIVSPVRKIDEDWTCNHVELCDKLIDMEFGK
jgi:hypothetical protein